MNDKLEDTNPLFISTIRKWDSITRKYKKFISPAKRLVFFTKDMDKVIDCTNCGEELIYGKSYTSKTIHNHIGLAWPVCGECYEKELEDEEMASATNSNKNTSGTIR